jgi:DNA invertase Pin-like site-specific DNA recombinase
MSSAKMGESTRHQVAIYERSARVRDCEQARSDKSIEYCLRQFGEAPIVFNDDGCSGRLANRAGLRKLMMEMEAGNIRALVVRDVWALGRDLPILVFITEKRKRHGVELHSVISGGLVSTPAPCFGLLAEPGRGE